MAYLAGTNLNMVVALRDDQGASVAPTSMTFSVYDGNGVSLVVDQPVIGYVAGQESITILVLAAYNTLAVGQNRAAREIFIKAVTDAGTVAITHTYVVQGTDQILVKGVNSAVTLATADMLAQEMSNMESWLALTRAQKSAALIEAYQHLCKLRFIPLDSSYYDSNDTFKTDMREGLESLSISEFNALDSKFLEALSYAQIAQADYIANEQPEQDKRDGGIILDTIGEVKQMYRSSKPLTLAVCKRAIGYLTKYTTLGVKVLGRA